MACILSMLLIFFYYVFSFPSSREAPSVTGEASRYMPTVASTLSRHQINMEKANYQKDQAGQKLLPSEKRGRQMIVFSPQPLEQ